MFTSNSSCWETPQPLFDQLNSEFHFTLDVCALPENHKCDRYFTPEQDGLTQAWTGTCFMNPPYGRQIGKWIRKAYESAAAGATVVCLIPSRTDTLWFHQYILGKAEVRFLRGRVYFKRNGAPTDRAPFPSAIVVFRPPEPKQI